MKLEMLAPTGEGRRSWIARAPFSQDIQHALERIFENVFCSAARCADANPDEAAHAYVVAVEDDIRLVIMFTKQGAAVKVLNEIFSLSGEDLTCFARDVFQYFKDVDLVSLPAVSIRDTGLPYPFQRFNATEDLVAPLPETAEHYWSMLSRNTKESIRRYRKRIAQQFPEIKFDFYERDRVSLAQIRSIVDLSSARLELKRETPNHSEQSIAQLARLVGQYGVTLIASLHGKICGGVICTRIGGNFFMHVIAHDPELDALRLGKVCCYLSICDAIGRGGREYHMLSGQYDYKFRFMGQQRDYDRITLYRSYRSMLAHWPRYVLNGVRGEGRMIKKIIKTWRRKWSRLQTGGAG